ncbi:hypothetical protein ETD83_12865 [Actinomadura soli]|uniref:OmpR/PhoB-type domain-containing protein n=1 Tax=Actinomadura soli TaxID=2508997 RepID=A0A5C4JDD9_9ACTN|nr:hypothetical protein ETD83_12865 [Actinomadura soli]
MVAGGAAGGRGRAGARRLAAGDGLRRRQGRRPDVQRHARPDPVGPAGRRRAGREPRRTVAGPARTPRPRRSGPPRLGAARTRRGRPVRCHRGRPRAITRRAPAEESPPTVDVGRHSVDLAGKIVHAPDGTRIHLTPTEWGVLEVLVRNRGKLITHRRLLAEVWGPKHLSETNYLRVYMATLRRKLEDDPARPRHLITEPGMGYRFDP